MPKHLVWPVQSKPEMSDLSPAQLHKRAVIPDVFDADYPDGGNSSEYLIQPTTYLPENFTYVQHLPCPERLPSMSEYTGT